MQKTCGECRKRFTAKSSKAMWCSDRCRKRNSRRPASKSPKRTLAVAPEPGLEGEQAALLDQLTQGADLSPAPAREPASVEAEVEEDAAPPAPPEPSPFERATLVELERMKATDTMLGQQALAVARRIAGDSETGAAVASLSREHSRLMEQIAIRSREQADPVEKARAAGAYVYRGPATPAAS